jgi:hypothetical protein
MKKQSWWELWPAILFIVLLERPAQADTSSLQSSIDSLKAIRAQLSGRVKALDRQIDSLMTRLAFSSVKPGSSGGVIVQLRADGKLRKEPNPLADGVPIPYGAEVEVIDSTQDYFLIQWNGLRGYINSLYIPSNKDTDRIAELGKAKDEARKAEQQRREKDKEKVKRQEQKKKEEQRKAAIKEKYGEEKAARILAKEIWLGMTKEMAIDSWGMPQKVNRTLGTFGVHEQWIYGDTYLYFENGFLTSWQD